MAQTVFVLNGPNLNLLGKRQPEIYGHETLDDVRTQCEAAGAPHGIAIELKQSNHECQIIDWIHEARERAAGIIIRMGRPSASGTASARIFSLRCTTG